MTDVVLVHIHADLIYNDGAVPEKLHVLGLGFRVRNSVPFWMGTCMIPAMRDGGGDVLLALRSGNHHSVFGHGIHKRQYPHTVRHVVA